eukprot:3259234-Pyramimonas_sp.AAC.1
MSRLLAHAGDPALRPGLGALNRASAGAAGASGGGAATSAGSGGTGPAAGPTGTGGICPWLSGCFQGLANFHLPGTLQMIVVHVAPSAMSRIPIMRWRAHIH